MLSKHETNTFMVWGGLLLTAVNGLMMVGFILLYMLLGPASYLIIGALGAFVLTPFIAQYQIYGKVVRRAQLLYSIVTFLVYSIFAFTGIYPPTQGFSLPMPLMILYPLAIGWAAAAVVLVFGKNRPDHGDPFLGA